MFNEGVGLEGHRLRLVPYLPQHVPRYHEWMCDADILHATESDPLSLDEEIENQQSWLTSSDKLTFIILAPLSLVVPEVSGAGFAEAIQTSGRIVPSSLQSTGNDLASNPSTQNTSSKPSPDVFVMIGDCNLFLLPNMEEEEEGEEGGHANNDSNSNRNSSKAVDTLNTSDASPVADNNNNMMKKNEKHSYEVEVMVADKLFRGKGAAQEAVRLIMSYAMDALHADHFVAKILDSNLSSIGLFQEKLGFKKFAEIRVFNEVHLDVTVTGEAEQKAWKESCGYRKGDYASLADRTLVLEAVPASFIKA